MFQCDTKLHQLVGSSSTDVVALTQSPAKSVHPVLLHILNVEKTKSSLYEYNKLGRHVLQTLVEP